MRLSVFVIILTCLLPAQFSGQGGRANANEILKQADRARAGGLPGVTWKVHLVSTDDGGEVTRDMIIKAADDDSRVEFLAPPKVKGQRMLIAGRNMWFAQPGLEKPIPISPRLRLSGQAANGDIASTNYSRDYEPSLIGEETVHGQQCYVLDLRATNKSVTYDRIVYWVSKSLLTGVQADFYTVSGKKFKTARFEYENNIEYQGRRFPFISKMTIVDAIHTANRTVMEYRDVKVGVIPAAEFNINLLLR